MIRQSEIFIPFRGCKILLALFFTFPLFVSAQSANQVYIFPSASIYAHPNSNISIYSDTYQAGTFGSFGTSRIDFYATIWQNESKSRMPDESARGIDGTGGVFRFSDLIRQTPQVIFNTNPLPFNGFPNLRIDNATNVTTALGNLHVNNNLDFVKGHLILNDFDVNVGRPGTGSISGYGEESFIVTGSSMEGGGLIRNTSATSQALDYPIGTAIGSYTPLTIKYNGFPQTVKFRVADNVYQKLNFPEYVYKTWIMTTTVVDPDAKVDLTLQHNSADEGIRYYSNRSDAYISRYNIKLTGLWDVLEPMSTSTPGVITTRQSVAQAYMNTRLNIDAIQKVEYFTKSVIKEDIDESTPVNIPDAISPNGDGFNDVYEVVKRLPTDVVRFEVYSRNQVLVYQNLDYQNTFDGTGNMGGLMGDTLPDGIYYYLISVNGAKGIPGYLIINR